MTKRIDSTDAPMSRRTLVLLAGAGAVLAVASYRYVRGVAKAPGQRLTVHQAHKQAQAGAVTLIDIRRPEEWKETGIGDGAVPIDLRRPDFVEALLTTIQGDPSRPVALICAKGVRSRHLAKALRDIGFARILDVPEGMLGSASGPCWLAQGLPVVAHEEDQNG